MENRMSIRDELGGKTDMNEENEKDLFLRLEEIERDGEIVEALPKQDWVMIGITFLFIGIGPLLYYAVTLL